VLAATTRLIGVVRSVIMLYCTFSRKCAIKNRKMGQYLAKI